LQVGATLAQVQGVGFQVGAGAAVNLGPLQIYAASDNVASVVNLGNARNAQVNVGINLVFGRGKTKTDVAMQDSTAADSTLIASVDSSDQKKEKVRPEKVKKEKTTVAKTKERPEPVKTTPVVVAAPTLRPWVNLRGTTYNASSKELMTGVTVELYQKQSDREVLAYVRGNPGIDILAPMERNREYRVVVKKNGYKPTETTISLDELAGIAELKKDFFLEAAPVEPPTVVSKPAEKPVVTSDTTSNDKPGAILTPDPKNSIVAPQPNSNKLLVYMAVITADLKPTASADGATVIKVGTGYRVQLLEKTNADWWLVSFRGYNGYLQAKALREEK